MFYHERVFGVRGHDRHGCSRKRAKRLSLPVSQGQMHPDNRKRHRELPMPGCPRADRTAWPTLIFAEVSASASTASKSLTQIRTPASYGQAEYTALIVFAFTYELFDADESWLVETYVAAAILIHPIVGALVPRWWMLLSRSSRWSSCFPSPSRILGLRDNRRRLHVHRRLLRLILVAFGIACRLDPLLLLIRNKRPFRPDIARAPPTCCASRASERSRRRCRPSA